MFHGLEVRFEDLKLEPQVSRCFFGQPNRANVRLTEYGGRDEFVVHDFWIVPKLGVSKCHGLGYCDWRELRAACHIAQGKNTGLLGLELRVGFDVPSTIEPDLGVLKAQAFNVGVAASRAQYRIHNQRAAIGQCRLIAIVDRGQRFDIGVKAKVNTGLANLFGGKAADITVESAHEEVASVELCYL